MLFKGLLLLFVSAIYCCVPSYTCHFRRRLHSLSIDLLSLTQHPVPKKLGEFYACLCCCNLSSGKPLYQMSTRLSTGRYIGSPSETSNASWNSAILERGPLQRISLGPCGSIVSNCKERSFVMFCLQH